MILLCTLFMVLGGTDISNPDDAMIRSKTYCSVPAEIDITSGREPGWEKSFILDYNDIVSG